MFLTVHWEFIVFENCAVCKLYLSLWILHLWHFNTRLRGKTTFVALKGSQNPPYPKSSVPKIICTKHFPGDGWVGPVCFFLIKPLSLMPGASLDKDTSPCSLSQASGTGLACEHVTDEVWSQCDAVLHCNDTRL